MDSYDREGLWIAIWVVLGFLVLMFGIICIGERASFPGRLARIEQLRSDAAKIDVRQSEDVYGQVVDANKEIKAKRVYNQIWWAQWSVLNKWDEVDIIDVGGEQ